MKDAVFQQPRSSLLAPRRLNIRFLLCLLVVVAVLVPSVRWVHSRQQLRMVGLLRARAEAAQAAGETKSELRAWRQYLALSPNDLEAVRALSRAMIKRAKTPREKVQVFLHLDKALRQFGGDTTLRRWMIDLATEMYRYSDAVSHLSKLAEQFPENGAIGYELAVGLSRAGRFNDSLSQFQKAIALEPDYCQSYEGLANLYDIHFGETGRAIDVLNYMVDFNRHSPSAYLIRGRFLARQGLFERAARDFDAAERISPQNADVLYHFASHLTDLAVNYRRNGRFSKSRQLFESAADRVLRGLTEHQSDVRFYVAYANLLMHMEQTSDSIEILRRGLALAPDNAGLCWPLAQILIERGGLDEADDLIDRLGGSGDIAPELVLYLRGRMEFARGEWSKAARILDRIQSDLSDHPKVKEKALLYLRFAYGKLGLHSNQEATARALFLLNPSYGVEAVSGLSTPELRKRVDGPAPDYRNVMTLADRLARAGKSEQARNYYRKATTIAPNNSKCWTKYVRFLAKQGDRETLNAVCQSIERQELGEAKDFILAVCYHLAGDDRARERLRAALRSGPAHFETLQFACEFHETSGSLDKCIPILNNALTLMRSDSSPAAAWCRNRLAVLLVGSDPKQHRAALALVEKNLADGTAREESLRAKALLLSNRASYGEKVEALEILRSLVSGEEAKLNDYVLVGEIQHSLGDVEKAMSVFRQAVSSLVNRSSEATLSSSEFRLLVSLYLKLGNWRRALSLVENRDSSIAPEDLWETGLAAFKADYTSRKLLQKLRDSCPGEFEHVAYDSLCLIDQGDIEEAINKLRGFLTAGQGQPALGNRLRRVGDLFEMVSHLDSTESQIALCHQARRCYLDLFEQDVTSLEPLIEHLIKHDEFQEALRLVSISWSDLPPKVLGAVLVHIFSSEHLAKDDRSRLLTRLMRRCLAEAPRSLELEMLVARIREQTGGCEDAAFYYAKVLDKDPDNVMALNNLAMLSALGIGEPKAGLEYINHAIDVAGPVAQLLDTRGMVYLAQGKIGACVRDLERSCREAPRAHAFFHLARAFLEQNSHDQARHYFEVAHEYGLLIENVHPLEREVYSRLSLLTGE